MFAGLSIKAQATVLELIEGTGMEGLCPLMADEGEADRRLGDVLAEAVQVSGGGGAGEWRGMCRLRADEGEADRRLGDVLAEAVQVSGGGRTGEWRGGMQVAGGHDAAASFLPHKAARTLQPGGIYYQPRPSPPPPLPPSGHAASPHNLAHRRAVAGVPGSHRD